MATPPENSDPPRPLRWDHVLAALLLAGMTLIAGANILSRFCLHYSLAFTEEVTINLFVWLTVVGSGIAFERGAQLGMVSCVRYMPRSVRRVIAAFGALLSAAVFVAVDIALLQAIIAELRLFHAVSPALGIPVWIYYAGVLPCSLIVFRGVWRGARAEWKALDESPPCRPPCY